MKLANSTVFAIAVAGGFSLTAYVMGQAPGAAGSGPATSMPTNPGQTQGAAQPQTTIGPITGATIGPTTSATIGPTTGPSKSTSAKSKASSKKTSTKPSAATSPKQ